VPADLSCPNCESPAGPTDGAAARCPGCGYDFRLFTADAVLWVRGSRVPRLAWACACVGAAVLASAGCLYLSR